MKGIPDEVTENILGKFLSFKDRESLKLVNKEHSKLKLSKGISLKLDFKDGIPNINKIYNIHNVRKIVIDNIERFELKLVKDSMSYDWYHGRVDIDEFLRWRRYGETTIKDWFEDYLWESYGLFNSEEEYEEYIRNYDINHPNDFNFDNTKYIEMNTDNETFMINIEKWNEFINFIKNFTHLEKITILNDDSVIKKLLNNEENIKEININLEIV